jgi:signal transduction histidine kinase
VDGSVAGYIGSAIDVTERKLAEQALATVRNRLIQAQEEERARIARELHDDINQRLALLSFRLSALAKGDSSTSGHEIEAARADVVALAMDVQALSHRLHPSNVEYLGISGAAERLCRDLSRQHRVDIGCRAEEVPERLPRDLAVCLYRVLQEALQNAVKHSGAAKVEVLLRGAVDQVEMTIRDFGVGFDPQASQRHGLGLTSMKERLIAVRGQLAIESNAEHGTTIRALVPLAGI